MYIMKKSQQNDALLALISTLTVVFIVLFISLAYFMTFRTTLEGQEAYIDQLVEEMKSTAQQAPANGSVAGYETDVSY
jgi:Na+-transporting methylmalonyl-CoA/oxaloacetate decarboxylase gamma subunit